MNYAICCDYYVYIIKTLSCPRAVALANLESFLKKGGRMVLRKILQARSTGMVEIKAGRSYYFLFSKYRRNIYFVYLLTNPTFLPRFFSFFETVILLPYICTHVHMYIPKVRSLLLNALGLFLPGCDMRIQV